MKCVFGIEIIRNDGRSVGGGKIVRYIRVLGFLARVRFVLKLEVGGDVY